MYNNFKTFCYWVLSRHLFFYQDIQRLIGSLLKHQNLFTDGEFFSAKLLKSMQEMEKIIDHKAIFISVFGQHNCGKSSFLNALMGET